MARECAAPGVGAGQYTKITSSGNTIFATGRNWFGNTVLDVFDTSTPELPVLAASNAVGGLDNFSLSAEPGFVLGAGNPLTLYDLGSTGQRSKRGWLDIPPALTGVPVGEYAHTFPSGHGPAGWPVAPTYRPPAPGPIHPPLV